MNISQAISKLGIDPDSYVVIGSGVLDELNIRSTSDVDLIVKASVYKKFKGLSGWTEKQWPQGEPTVQKGNYELGTDWGDDTKIYSFDEVYKNSEIINNTRFVTLEFLKKWKNNKGRNKDLRDVELIDKYLAKNS